MAHRKLTAIIEKGSDYGYSIYIPEISGIYGSGLTEDEAKESLFESVEAIISYAKETGKWGEYIFLEEGAPALEYKYDLSGFFLSHNYFDVTALANRIGLNASLLRGYKTGARIASVETKKKIEEGIHSLAHELCVIEF